MTTQKINVIIQDDTDNFNGEYQYISGDNHYEKVGNPSKYLAYNEGGAKFLNDGNQYYWVIPCSDFELLFDKTINFSKYSGGYKAVTITRVQEKKRSTAAKKIKWSK